MRDTRNRLGANRLAGNCLGGALRAGAVALSLILAAPPVAPAYADDDDNSGEYVPGEVVLQLKDGADLGGVAGAFGLALPPLDQFGSRPIYRLRTAGTEAPPDLAERVKGDSRVLQASPNYVGEVPEGGSQSSWAVGGDDGAYRTQWAPGKMRLPDAHAQNARGDGVTVAVLDTGVDPAHPALAGRLAPGRDFVDLDGDPSEAGARGTDAGFGHGTHVAGLVALAAPQARVLPVRVLDPRGRGNLWVLAEGLEYALNPDGRPETADGAGVLNLSISFKREVDLLEDLLEEATCDDDDDDGGLCALTGGRGAVVVAAAGNGGGTVPEYPAAEGEGALLAVAASTPADTLAGFSTRGPWVHLAAPGEGVLSAVPGGQFGTWSGTSMATALVSGQVALVRGRFPGWGAEQVARQVVNTAAPIAGPVPRRADAAAAVTAPATSPPSSSPTRSGDGDARDEDDDDDEDDDEDDDD